ncbi:MAG: PDZ domain-containing protein, partial [Vicinamibacterales bacterium]
MSGLRFSPIAVAAPIALALWLTASSLWGQSSASRAAAIDTAFEAFWSAGDVAQAQAAVPAIIASGVTFDEAHRRLRAGRTFRRDVPTGVVLLERRGDDEQFFYSVDVPASYDPTRRYQVRVQLHGGVGAGEDNRRRGTGAIGALAGDPQQIYVIPTSWLDVTWWNPKQLRNLRAILDTVKRTYNVDENRVVLSGVSDGGTGAYYAAMRDTTPYASYLPLIGSLMQLAAREFNVGDLYPNNLLNKPFFVVNTGRDPLYPTRVIDPVVENLRRAGVSIAYHPRPDDEHDVSWWPDIRDDFERFAREHPREPHPARLTWQSGEGDPFNRAHWLVIDEVAAEVADPLMPDVNQVATPASLRFGVLAAGATVTRVVPSSDAAAFGLRRGDVVLAIDGTGIAGEADLERRLAVCCEAGSATTIVVQRAGQRVHLTGIPSGRSANGDTVPLFARRRPVGRVDLTRAGNAVRATTSGVHTFT